MLVDELDMSPMTERPHTVFEPLQVESGRPAYPSAVNHLLHSGTKAVAACIYGFPWSRNPGGCRVRYVAFLGVELGQFFIYICGMPRRLIRGSDYVYISASACFEFNYYPKKFSRISY